MRARRVAVTRAAGRRRLRRLVAGLVLTLCTAGVIGAVYSPFLRVRHVRVEGLPDALAADVARAATNIVGRPLFLTDLGAIRATVRRHPFVLTADIRREPPGTVWIRATERVGVAAIETSDGFAIIGADGVVTEVVATPPPGLPTMSATRERFWPPGGGPAAASSIAVLLPGMHAGEAADGISAVVALPDAVGREVRSARFGRNGELRLQLGNGAQINLGDPRHEPQRKGAVLAQMMASPATDNPVAEYVLVSADAPAVRRERPPPPRGLGGEQPTPAPDE